MPIHLKRRDLRTGLGAVALLAAGLALSACADPWQPGSKHALVTGLEADDGPPPEEFHCYRTLAKVECYRTPLPDGENRRVGWADVERRPVEE